MTVYDISVHNQKERISYNFIFLGTGNSEYTAQRIGKEIDDKVINLFDKIRNIDYSDMKSERPWVIVVPTYAWRIPHIVSDWLEKTNFSGNKEIYFVMTCGGNIGNAGKYLETLCAKKNMNYCGCAEIVMPENYIALFSTPTKDKALQIINQSERIIDSTALHIKNGDKLPKRDNSFENCICPKEAIEYGRHSKGLPRYICPKQI